uniref:Centrosomal protein 57kDa-like protein 1 n=1 Tax=Tetraodon nigroviridis TaxID=99883 RepID=H3D405_TETNG
DSPSKDSFIGSYYQPPVMITPTPGHLGSPANAFSTQPPPSSPPASSTSKGIDGTAFVNALKNLQQKIDQMELEKKQAKAKNQQLSHRVTNHQPVSSPYVEAALPTAGQPGPDGWNQEEYTLKLQSVEAQCKILEKQFNYMRKMVEIGNKERKAVAEKQSLLPNLQPSSSDVKSQGKKLERLEIEYSKLSRTQALADTKLAILEEKLQKETCQRLLVQEKAERLQRELDTSLRSPAWVKTEEKKTQTPRTAKNPPQQCQVVLLGQLKNKKMPFVAGKSTSPSHSVHANVQSVLHMMKHHQPWLCEQVSALHAPAGAIRRNLSGEFSSKPARKPQAGDQSLDSLSDLLLALQDELGQMSFEHQDLLRQLGVVQNREEKEDLKLELESLVSRMEEKGAQITKLRKHWQMVQKLMQGQRGQEVARRNALRPSAASPVKMKRTGRKEGPVQNNLQLLRETQKFRNNLREDDVSWDM